MAPVVHQALHGYSDGHRLISSSVPLSSNDARTMVVMSDLSGPGVKPEPSGYLTGYPLEGTGKYILARTWAAPEMPRPGCVWTHSLIIDNADLAILTSADSLLAAFRRPDTSSKSNYTEPVSIRSISDRPHSLRQDRAREILNALYAEPEHPIVADATHAVEDERLIVSIWMQQWPRLRRAFGFCSLAGMDRSGKGVALDLQLVRSPDRQVRTRFPNATGPSEVTQETALEPLLADLEGRGDTQIREFLRRTGGDVDGGRRAMLPLCLLYSALFAKNHPNIPAAVHALSRLDSFGTRQARSVRTLIARKALEDVDDLDEAVFSFVLDTLEQVARPEDQHMATDRVGAALWRRSPLHFMDAIDAGGIIGRACTEALDTIAALDLVTGLQDHPSLAERIAQARPDLLLNASFWSIPGVDDDLAAGISSSDAGRAAAALMAAGRGGPASVIVERADPRELAATLGKGATAPALEVWLTSLMRDKDKAAAVLATGQISNRSIIIGMAHASDPDGVPNDYGEDPWLIAVRAAPNLIGQMDEDYFAAFLISRAIGYRSRSQAELVQSSYTRLYRALEQSRLPRDVEYMVTSRLDWGGWFSWDNCSRLRDTIVRRFIDRYLDPEIFGRLTDDSDLSLALIDEAASTGRGRRYLGEVRRRLKDAGGNKQRTDYIASKIK